jgi:hypothetical protein
LETQIDILYKTTKQGIIKYIIDGITEVKNNIHIMEDLWNKIYNQFPEFDEAQLEDCFNTILSKIQIEIRTGKNIITLSDNKENRRKNINDIKGWLMITKEERGKLVLQAVSREGRASLMGQISIINEILELIE